MTPTYRRATEDDLAGEFAVFIAAEEELRNRRGIPFTGPPFDPAGRWAQVHRHVIAHDGERAYVAEEDGWVIGFAAAIVRGDLWYLSALFIDPTHQGRGIGKQLLDRVWGSGYRWRATITEAIQPVSNGLYARRGMLPLTPVLSLSGRPRIEVDPSLEAAELDAAALRAIDLAAYGFDRAVDHELFARFTDRGTLWLRGGEPCAYSYRGGFAGAIGPVAGLDAETAAAALRNQLALNADAEVQVDIPGTASALVSVALEAGLRFSDPGLLLLSPPERAPTAYAIHSYWLL
jgi:GNAT superfamily N-acetyltransferase